MMATYTVSYCYAESCGFLPVNDDARPSCDEPGTGERSLLSVDPAQRSEVTKRSPEEQSMQSRREFYAEVDAKRAEADRQETARFRGLCDGLEGKPRVNPCTPDYVESWFKGYDEGVVKAALYRLAKPESERASAAGARVA